MARDGQGYPRRRRDMMMNDDDFHRWASLVENILQLSDNSGRILSVQWPPYCKSRPATVDDGWKILIIVVGYVHRQSVPIVLHAGFSFFPASRRRRIYRSTGFAGFHNRVSSFFGHLWVNQPGKV